MTPISRPPRARLPRINAKVALARKPQDSENDSTEDLEQEAQCYTFTPEGIKVGARLWGGGRATRCVGSLATQVFFSVVMAPGNPGPPLVDPLLLLIVGFSLLQLVVRSLSHHGLKRRVRR